MAIKFKTKVNQLTSINYSKLKNPMFREFKIYSPKDNSKYITLQRASCVEHYDDNDNFLGSEFLVNIPEKNMKATEIFIPVNAPLFTLQIGKEIYGFKINYDS